MVFSSLLFLFIYLPIFLATYFIVPKKFRNAIIFVFSLLFYAWGEPIYVGIMIFSTVLDFTIGLIIDKYREHRSVPKIALLISVLVNLGMLGFFKYSGFFMDNINNLFDINMNVLRVALPIGISFYTFQTMSYTIDLYRGKIGVQKNIISFGAYVSMFPQLIAGPVVAYSHVEKEINDRTETIDKFAYGISRFIEGLGKKVLIANSIGLLWDTIKNMPENEVSVVIYWVGMIAFGLQLYFDFSGYSDMAVGLGSMMGFTFPENFNYPYISKSVTEFWRRWHITLGSWFREYVYIPLGGNRVSKWRLYFNIFTVWFLTGFWHGAGWNFIVWGIFFGVIMIIEKTFLLKYLEKIPPILSRGYLMIVILISWTFFSLDTLSESFVYLNNMFGLGEAPLVNERTMYLLSNYWLFLEIGIIFSTPIPKKIKSNLNGMVLYVFYVTVLILSTAYLVDSTFNPFLYFRF